MADNLTITKEDLRIMNVIYEALLSGSDIVVKNEELKRIFGNITPEDIAKWNSAYASAHGHNNLAVLNQITQEILDDLDVAGAGTIVGGENVGLGAGLYAGVDSDVIQIKSLVQGTGISITQSPTQVTINASGGNAGYPHPNWLSFVLIKTGNEWGGSGVVGVDTIPALSKETNGDFDECVVAVGSNLITIDSASSYLLKDTRVQCSQQDYITITHNVNSQITIDISSVSGICQFEIWRRDVTAV